MSQAITLPGFKILCASIATLSSSWKKRSSSQEIFPMQAGWSEYLTLSE